MIDTLDPRLRKQLVAFRCAAMQGQLAAITDPLQQIATREFQAGRHDAAMAFAMLFAELLHLNGQDVECADFFETTIVPNIAHVSKEAAIIADYNRAHVDMALLRPMPYFSSLQEKCREIGLELTDVRSLFYASEDALRGKHYDALPAFWREFVRTHRLGCWHVSIQAAVRLAREYLQIEAPHDAAWYALYGQDEKVAREAAQTLLKRRDALAVRQTLKNLLLNGNLCRHFSIACEILATVADGIPDDLVDEIATWLLPRCSVTEDPRPGTGPVSIAWKALEKIGARLCGKVAKQAIQIAVTHPRWNEPVNQPTQIIVEREDIVDAVTCLVEALPVDDLASLASHAIPLATDRMLNHDYHHVVDLLCTIAQRGDTQLRTRMGDQLFIEGKPRAYLLGQVANLFGKDFLPPERLAGAADQVVDLIGLQVQRLDAGQNEKEYPGHTPKFTAQLNGGTIVVNLPTGIELEAIARNRAKLGPEKIGNIVHAILHSIQDRENFLVNKCGLIEGLASFADCLTDTLISDVFSVLKPLADGAILEPTIIPPAAAADNRLSRFTGHMGSPSDVRGKALVTLAQIERAHPTAFGSRFKGLLQEALTDLDADVRRRAFIAAQLVPKLSENAVMAVLQGLRDQDPNSGAAAFYVLTHQGKLRLRRPQWSLFLNAVKMAMHNSSKTLRAAAAAALLRLSPMAPTESIKSRVRELEAVVLADFSFAVRSALTKSNEL
ncbi:MAG TPA: hypothetical protein VE988_28775 [Gemmataceae bacterium]|nr:hypothetical protein [Gemmataceae bacterium]